MVQVQDAQGRPAHGVSVEFQVGSSWADSAVITPQHTVTQNGMARAIIEPKTTGVVRVMARVDHLTQEATFFVATQQTGNGAAPPGLTGLPYPPY